MFNTDFYIDAFQHTKKTVTNQVITDPTLNKAANQFIEKQTEFAKMLTRNAQDVTKYYVDNMTHFLFPKKEQK